jgi:uncharacterized protein
MRKIFVLIAVFLFNSTAYGLPASRESVEILLGLSGAESLMSSTNAYTDQIAQDIMKEVRNGKILNAEQQRRSDEVYASLLSMVRREFNWDAMKPRYVQLYLDTFDQAEVDGLIAFYQSPLGRALVAKSPALVKNSMRLGADVVASLMPKLKQAAATSYVGFSSAAGVSCPTMVAPEMPRQAIVDKVEGVVRVKATIRKGVVTDVKVISGPEIFHESVIAALKQYKCSYSETVIEAVQEFAFKVETQSSNAVPAAKTP